jgi:acetylornithine/N-succinyldiaminopimelate aminotransferase
MIANSYPALMPCYNRLPVAFKRGEGVFLYDINDKEYLDFAGGIAVASLGHCHPHLVEILKKQADNLWHTSNMYQIPAQEELGERLVSVSFADSVFFTNSGVEAIECALKLARKAQSSTGHAERYRVITYHNAFHGRSLATIAATGREKLTKGFGPMLDGFDQVDFLDIAATRAAITSETAAIMVEPVQGEGGILTASPTELQELRALADEHDLLLIFDEIQCGMGRCGKLFAFEWAGVEPDIVASAKGIGSGFPMGACLATGDVAQHLTTGSHGTTYGGNPLAMAVGNGVMDIMLEPSFLPKVQETAKYLRQKLEALMKAHPNIIVDVRGLGLMLGVELSCDARPVLEDLLENGFLCAQAGTNVLRLLPPLIITKENIDSAVGFLDNAIVHLSPK